MAKHLEFATLIGCFDRRTAPFFNYIRYIISKIVFFALIFGSVWVAVLARVPTNDVLQWDAKRRETVAICSAVAGSTNARKQIVHAAFWVIEGS